MTTDVEEIRAALEACETVDQLDMVRARHRARVQAMATESEHMKTMAIQLGKLVGHVRRRIEDG